MKIHFAIATLISATLVLGGCAANDPLAVESTEKNYTSADGTITEIPAGNRGEPIVFESTNTTNGTPISSKDFLGNVVVVNFWFAACPPCRYEAPDLSDLATTYANDGVQFLGVNVYDGLAGAQSFEKSFGIPYPSVLDADDGAVRLSFANELPPNGVPTTLILDRKGRVAARVSGAIMDRATFESMLDSVVAEATP